MGRTDKTFRPAKFETTTPVIAFDIVSGNYFKVANHLRSSAREGHPGMAAHWFVFPAVTMYVAAFEAFLQERLSVSFRRVFDSNEPQRDQKLCRIRDLKAQSKSSAKSTSSAPDVLRQEAPPKRTADFKDWVKAVFLHFDRTRQGIDASSPTYRNLLALKDLRNAVVHYNPAFIEHVDWPLSLQQALQCSKVDVHNSGWVTTFSQVEVADWAHRTVRDAVQLFAMISGYRDPFLVPLEFHGMEPWPSE